MLDIYIYIYIYIYIKNKCRFSYGRFFSDRKIILKSLDPSLDPEERHEILDPSKCLLEKVKKYMMKS